MSIFSADEFDRIVGQIRAHWLEPKIRVRGDAGFCREAIMARCEQNRVHFVLGLAQKIACWR